MHEHYGRSAVGPVKLVVQAHAIRIEIHSSS
jgi:hypothetical protein